MAVVVAPDGSWLASASRDGTVRIWDAATGHVQALMRADNDIRACSWLSSDAVVSGVKSNGANVLMVTPIHDGSILTAVPNSAWGLHVDDPNLALGNLVDLVHSEAAAYISAHRPPA